MSLTIALKHNGVVYMGSDSLAHKGGVNFYLTNFNCYRIFKVKECSNMLMSLTGSFVEHNVARCSRLVPESVAQEGKVDFEFMVNDFVPRLFDLFENRHLIKKGNDDYSCNSEMIVAYKDKLFSIFQNGAVIESDDYLAIGDGVEEALGSLLTTAHIDDPKKRLLMSLRAALAKNANTAYPLLLIDTEACEYEIINE